MPPSRLHEIRRHCLCEGDQEIAYIKQLQFLLREQGHKVSLSTEKLQVSPGGISTSMYMGFNYPVIAIFDHDNREAEFPAMVRSCQKPVQAAYSNRCFDLWLLLHKEDFAGCVSENKGYIEKVRRAYKLDKDANIKSEAIREKMINSITIDHVKDAIYRAEFIRKSKPPSDGKRLGKYTCYDNPDLLIHEFIKEVFRRCGMMKQ